MLRHGFVPASPSHHRFKLLLQPCQESFDFESIRMTPLSIQSLEQQIDAVSASALLNLKFALLLMHLSQFMLV